MFEFASMLLHNCKTAEPINNKSDYYRVKSWKKKTVFWYSLFTVIAVLLFLVLSDTTVDLMGPIAIIVMPCVLLLTAWGFASMILNFKLLTKSMFRVGTEGYKAGEQIQTTNTYITHEYGDVYKVRTETDNKGCAVALINGFINLLIWAFLCVYVCPFLTFKKIKRSNINLRRFKSLQY